VARLEREAELGVQPPPECFEHLIRHLDHRIAALAHEMVVGVVDKVVHGRTVAEVDVVDDAEPFEVLEEAVDGRFVDVGKEGLDPSGELCSRGVVSVVDERLQDGASRGGHSPTPCP